MIIGQLDLEGRIRQHLNYGAFKLNNVILWQKNLSFPKCSVCIVLICFTAESGEDAADVAVIAHPLGDLLNTLHAGKGDQLQMLELLFLGIDALAQTSVRNCDVFAVELGDDHEQSVGVSAGGGLCDASDHGSGDLGLYPFVIIGDVLSRRSGTKTVFASICNHVRSPFIPWSEEQRRCP